MSMLYLYIHFRVFPVPDPSTTPDHSFTLISHILESFKSPTAVLRLLPVPSLLVHGSFQVPVSSYIS